MFYQDQIDSEFRFGDVIKGFVSATPKINNPPINSYNSTYSIQISNPLFYIILSPCCSISDKVISLSPLIPVLSTFFLNPYFTEDLTRINRIVTPDKALPPIAFEKMPEETKEEHLNKEPAYTFVDLFVYEKNELFPEYTISFKKTDSIQTNYYMIDFRNTYRVDCSMIKNPSNVPIDLKFLQLTVKTRSELRDKITKYYGRIPDDDIID